MISDNKVFLTTTNGNLEVLNFTDGKVLNSLNIRATSSPTIGPDGIYISSITGAGSSKESIGKYSLSDYRLLKYYDVLSVLGMLNKDKSGSYDGDILSRIYANMTYHGSRVLGYHGLTYFMNANELKCLDPAGEKQVWKHVLDSDAKDRFMQPLALDGQIAVATTKGKVLFYDAQTGVQKTEYNLGTELASTPVVANNQIYVGSKTGKMIIHKLNTPAKATGTMWSGGGSHNLWVE